MVINVRPVIEAGVGASLTREGVFVPGEMSLGELVFAPFEGHAEAPWKVEVSNVGEGVHARGRVRTEVRTVCARCLEEFVLPVQGEVDELFYKEPTVDEQGDELPVIDVEGFIDLEPILYEALLMALPFKPLHDENCRGLCSGCGVNLNREDCRCEEGPDPSHPFAGLRDLL
ncbi:MAG: DUF177 domain-containing protein [Actinomycetes bacterium]|jgi:uncharacterized protein|nr:DUF177 domain-containing protein [Actinomycetes bacterium]